MPFCAVLFQLVQMYLTLLHLQYYRIDFLTAAPYYARCFFKLLFIGDITCAYHTVYTSSFQLWTLYACCESWWKQGKEHFLLAAFCQHRLPQKLPGCLMSGVGNMILFFGL